jgi:serine/threonine protein kinase
MVIDGFTLDAEIHRGGMATIWRVTRPDIDMPICMKIPLILDGDDPGAIVSFEAEQMIMPRLSGPHAPRFIAAGDFAAVPHIVMELIAGEPLSKTAERAPLPWAEVAAIGAELAQAIHALHRQQVNHLDIKPANILRRPDGQIVLIDFGLSRHADLPDLLAEESHLPIGTGAFIAPEQVLGRRTDRRSDLFAAGAVLYRLATGELPFGDPVGTSALRERLWRDPAPPRKLNPDLPPAAQEIILRCLSVDPDLRHPSAAQLAYDLRHLDKVALTPLAERREPDSWWTVMKRKRKAPKTLPPNPVTGRRGDAPMIAVAVDLSEPQMHLSDAVRAMVQRILEIEPSARLVCVNVLKTSRLGVDQMVSDEGESLHIRRLVELKDWAAPLKLPETQISHHVVEATDPVDAILHFIGLNGVDHLVMGARSASPFRRYLGSVSAAVVSQAACSVTIVRLPPREDHEQAEAVTAA